jgi:hypothetical protein
MEFGFTKNKIRIKLGKNGTKAMKNLFCLGMISRC